MCEVLEEGEHYKVKTPARSFEDFPGSDEFKERLIEMVSLPLKYPESFKKAHTRPPRGILLWGPPKTSIGGIVEAAAKDAGAAYISSRAQDLMGDPHFIEHLFKEGLELAPCIIFIRDIDILAPRREAEGTLLDAPASVASPEVTRRLFQMVDDSADRSDLIIIGATHRPDLTDPALLRNGRIDRKIFVPEPDFEDRVDIFAKILNDVPIRPDVTPDVLAELTRGYTHSDLFSIPREASLMAVKDAGDSFERVALKHFKEALGRIPPVGLEVIKRYHEVYKEECKHRYMY